MPKEIYRFIIIGILNTLIHVFIALYASYSLSLGIVAANLSGFLSATAFSFIMNTLWCFGKKLNQRNLFRFFLVSLLLLSFNLIISLLAEDYQAIPAAAILFASILTPVISFLLHKYWTYRPISP